MWGKYINLDVDEIGLNGSNGYGNGEDYIDMRNYRINRIGNWKELKSSRYYGDVWSLRKYLVYE